MDAMVKKFISVFKSDRLFCEVDPAGATLKMWSAAPGALGSHCRKIFLSGSIGSPEVAIDCAVDSGRADAGRRLASWLRALPLAAWPPMILSVADIIDRGGSLHLPGWERYAYEALGWPWGVRVIEGREWSVASPECGALYCQTMASPREGDPMRSRVDHPTSVITSIRWADPLAARGDSIAVSCTSHGECRETEAVSLILEEMERARRGDA